jgi:hypothetical protein
VEYYKLVWSGELTASVTELARYKEDLVGVEEVRWDQGGTVRQGLHFFYGRKRKSIANRIFCTLKNNVTS